MLKGIDVSEFNGVIDWAAGNARRQVRGSRQRRLHFRVRQRGSRDVDASNPNCAGTALTQSITCDTVRLPRGGEM